MTIEELQGEVGAWHRCTFPQCSIVRIARKLLEESSECFVASKDLAAAGEDSWREREEEMREEITDCAIVVLAMAEKANMPLSGYVLSKLSELKRRDQARRDSVNGLTE